MTNKRLLRLHFSQFRSLPIKNNTDAIVLPAPVVTTQGENGLPPAQAPISVLHRATSRL